MSQYKRILPNPADEIKNIQKARPSQPQKQKATEEEKI
jgi:hypothetical protein